MHNFKTLTARLLIAALLFAAAASEQPGRAKQDRDSLLVPGEKHLRNLKQLSFAGENAEAYFSSDGKQLIFQSTRDGHQCDQIYTMNADGSDVRMISTGEGRTTCSYF